jgi:hypothetical protein
VKPIEQQVDELRLAVLAMGNALGAALPHTPEVLEAFGRLAIPKGYTVIPPEDQTPAQRAEIQKRFGPSETGSH